MTLELPNLGTPRRPPRKVWESLHSRQKFVKKGQIMSSFILLLGNLSALLALKLRNFDGIFLCILAQCAKEDHNNTDLKHNKST